MSEDTPEKVEEQPEEPTAKKKVARKRSKAPEPKSEEKATVGANDDAEAGPEEKPSANAEIQNEEPSPVTEEGETPTENPSVRRISSKRKSSSESSDGDDAPDQIPTIVEPPGRDSQG